jgi:hypothetical protein
MNLCEVEFADGTMCGWPCGKGGYRKCAAHRRRSQLQLPMVPVERKKQRGASWWDEQGNKLCSTCEIYLPLGNFTAKTGGVTGFNNQCKTCVRWDYLRRTYNLSPLVFKIILERQGSVCAICGTVPDVWHVDHDHAHCPGERSCGNCVRGLLCQLCNTVIGAAGDRVGVLRKAIRYLEEE